MHGKNKESLQFIFLQETPFQMKGFLFLLIVAWMDKSLHCFIQFILDILFHLLLVSVNLTTKTFWEPVEVRPCSNYAEALQKFHKKTENKFDGKVISNSINVPCILM